MRPTDTTPLVRVGPPAGPPPLQVGNWQAQPPAGGRPPRRFPPALGWVLKGLGLVAVAVLSGLIWLTVHGGQRGGTPNRETSTAAQGAFQFTPVRENAQDTSCAEHSTGQVRAFFNGTQCTQMTRSLFTTTVADGGKVLVSVSVVQMPDAGQAAQLKSLVDANGTGNVRDLVADGAIEVPGGPPKGVAGGGYASNLRGNQVTIVESAFFPPHSPDDALLKRVSTDALRLGTG
ncbi:hypothetical protein GTS_21670 [Gandjariella thermophila]|uniref:Uncharacterized protein n=2 Tax=Gandjariella thermophila TaxID=1931992 RepID=A0A4D4J4Z4_9PSEU|nr:hypothetical protein GTS_21670 [Gandjariella thermophila]